MQTEFKKAVIPDDIPRLRAFDRKVFPKADLFGTKEWREYESYWMTIAGVAVGCCAFQLNVDFQDDLRDDDINPPMKASLYITTTGILPTFQHSGFGRLLKCWQIAYAKHNGFNRIVTNTRKRNRAMISMNRKFGFRIIRTTPRYYSGPTDATVVMELSL
jgi:ribosomal protein S18 acetylase RimI-like enzyme